MTDGEALMRAICESPYDDTRRLIYADYLQENGQEKRAAQIRKAIKNPRTKDFVTKPQWLDWRRMDRGPRSVTQLRTQRGFVAHVQIGCFNYYRSICAGGLFEQPITSIDLIGAFPGTVAPEGYCWTRWSIFSPRENRDVIDDTIFDRIGPTVFKTVLEARNRLSLELVNYGRQMCGLTPLEKADLIYPHVPRRRKPKVVLK